MFPLTRRIFLGGVSALAATPLAPPAAGAAADPAHRAAGPEARLHWLDGRPAATAGCAFGVPWPRGTLARTVPLALHAADGTPVPLQSWPLAYWPDGSVKWTGHAVTSSATAETFRLAPGTPAAPPAPVTVRRSPRGLTLGNGTLEVKVATTGPVAVLSVSRAGRVVARDGALLLRLQDRPDDPEESRAPHREDWTGIVERAEVEQPGPVRAVVKLTGRYRRDRGARAILPWTVRIYLGAGDESLRVVHSFRWDADEHHDFVRGLGMRFSVPLTDEAHNRHVRFGTAAGGVWGEPVRSLTGLRRDPGSAVREAQVAGTATPPVAQWGQQVRDGYQDLARWNDFTLFQESARHFAVAKRTSAAGSWLRHAGRGDRASGFGYVGGVAGGLGFGLHDFWQRAPRSLDIRGAATDTASVTLWSYSPQAPAMDLRTYDTVAHGLDLSYEDVQDGFATPQGVVRSTEMRFWALAATPARTTIAALSATLTTPPQLVTDPETYHAAGVFGRWSLPDRSTPARAALEDGITREVGFYADQVDEREWYGFWHYGDVMHTYDADRHEWRYDVGGYAWDNAELGTDALLWYVFLRSGDPRTFRLARAMTQHVSEADTHHDGRFAGLGSRHAVVHWGDGAKEARVGESFTKRFCYYLTADELLGELIRSSLRADETLRTVDPLREVLPPQTRAPARVRIGPDWYALAGNWLTEWERTGDVRWRDRIVTGMKDIAGFPAGLFTGEAGGAVGFDPATGHLVDLGKGDFDGGYNLAMAFLGEQLLWEALDLVDVPEFRRVFLDFARYVQAPSAEKIARYGRDFDPKVFRTIYSRVTAWAGEQLGDANLRRRGWEQFTGDPAGRPWPPAERVTGVAVPGPVTEIPTRTTTTPAGDFATFATNDFAQRNLATISLLAVAPAEAP
jgi:hypothetical protein